MGEGMWDLTGRTAIVTGASSGLGVTFSEALAGAGAGVVVSARRADRLEELAARIEDAGGRAYAVACDVSDPEQVAGLVRAAVERFGRLDVMVCNAGTVGDAGPMAERLPHDLFEQTVRVNLLGVWYCCRDAGAVMLAQGSGTIVNVSSTAGLAGMQHFPPAYQATKAAVINLTRNLALSWAGRGVRVNALAPGWFPSEMASPFIDAPVYGDHILRHEPTGRVGDPSELVGPLLFLASDASLRVTGQTLVVDGGHSAGADGRELRGRALRLPRRDRARRPRRADHAGDRGRRGAERHPAVALSPRAAPAPGPPPTPPG
jgi:NAD(P)-dependent dehydrogenase (short-subunit alcohol dehydrogenase family)